MRKKRLIAFILCFIACMLAIFSACTLLGKKTKGKVQITADMVRGIEPTLKCVYSGEPIVFPDRAIEVYCDGRYVSNEYFEYEYKDNLNVGTATIVVKATSDNPVLKGQTEIHFTIVADSGCHFEGATINELNAKLSDPNILAVIVWSPLTIEIGEKLYVPEGKTLYLDKAYALYVYGDFENEGKVVVASATMYNGEKRDTMIYNKGRILNHGEMELRSGAFLNSFSAVESDSDIPLGGKAYVNDEKPSFFKEHDGGVVYVRARVSEQNVTISEENRTCKKNRWSYEPEITLAGEKKYNYNVEYHNNDRAGEASVTVTVHEDSCLYYGTATIPFEIYKGTVSVSDLAELKTFSESGNYIRYEGTNLTIGEGESFSLKAEETLDISAQFTVNGTFENAGTVRARLFDAGETCKIENSGNIVIEESISLIEGEFENSANAGFSSEASVVFGETSKVANAGRVLAKGYISVRGSFENTSNGLIDTSSINQSGAIVNRGSISISGVGYFFSTATLENANGTIDLKSDSVFYDMNVINTGKITNGGRLVCMKLTRFENGENGFDNENGSVWTFDPFPYVTKNVTIRKYLTDESVTVSPDYSEVIYDGTRKEPAFTVNGETIPQEEYSRSATYTDRKDSPTLFNKAGTIEVSIHIKTNYSKYAGDYTFTYVIKRASVEVSTRNELASALGNDGYDKIYLAGDIANFRGSRDCLLSTATLYLNGHSIVFDGRFDNYGTIVSDTSLPIDYVPTKESAAIVLTARASFSNYGSIVNEHLLYAEGGSTFNPNATASSGAQGTIENNGLIYASSALIATGTGNLFVRKSLSEIASAFTIAEACYTGAALTPEVVCHYGATPIAASRFEFTYSDNVNAGAASVEVKVASDFDEAFYGTANLCFTISRAEIEVVSSDGLRTAAQNVNYEKIVLGSPIEVIENITLSEAQTLDLGSYELTFREGKVLTMSADCRLLVCADTKERFLKYVYGADEITLTADIAERVEINFTSFDLSEISGENILSTVVHMNGHSLSGGITLINSKMLYFSIEFENSSETQSKIGTEVGGYAFLVGTCSKATNLCLRNLTIYGFENSASGSDVLSITATECAFLGARDSENEYAFRVWSQSEYVGGTFDDCVFDGASGVYINAGCVYDHDTNTVQPSFFFEYCTFRAYGNYTDFYRRHYGNALVLERLNRRVSVKITESDLHSLNGNGIRLVGTVGLYCDVDTKTTIEFANGKSSILWDTTT